MTLTLRVACEHGRYDPHDVTDINTTGYWECPGGREPTVEETTQWLNERHYNVLRAVFSDADDSTIILRDERPKL